MRFSSVSVRQAYDRSAPRWAAGPATSYDVMANRMLAVAGRDIRGAIVLDLGAGTGPAARAARRAGAERVIGVDLSSQMLRVGTGWDGVVLGDAARLPLRDRCVDLVAAACSLGHMPDPLLVLRESRRVGAALVASAFLTGWTHPAKARIDAVAGEHGFVVPQWYVALKAQVEPVVDDPVRLEALAWDAGYSRVTVSTTPVDVAISSPEQLVSWRLGMAHLAPFVESLDRRGRQRLQAACVAAVGGDPPLVIPLVVLCATD